ncbi:MAG: hypothetical protein KF814_17095 [Nitrospiraceae bacterium]|nr:hypothetical protein [Nitrospiraceae bacterium]
MVLKKSLAWGFFVALFTVYAGEVPVSAAPGVSGESESSPSADLRQIRRFASVEVQTQGTAERLGIKRGELTDLARLALLNRIPGVGIEGSGIPSADAGERLHQFGFFACEVWTVGEQYIAAYHVDCTGGAYTAQRRQSPLWNQAILGYGPKEEVSDAVLKGLRALVEHFAATVANARAEGAGTH